MVKVAKKKNTIYRRVKSKINWKKELTKAGIGVGLGLAVKYGGGYVAKNNPQASELVRRAANVAAAVGGPTGEAAFQAADYGVNQLIVIPTGGAPLGGGAGEFA